MRLVKDRESMTGRYVNSAWRNGESGTFAVVIGVSAYPHLALTDNRFLTEAAAAWWAYDTENAGAAAKLVHEQHLIELLLHKVRSPLGATIAAHLLLEVRSHRIPHEWLQNLTEWFDRPDPPALLAEYALRRRADASWLEALGLVVERGMPHLSANVARLDAHVEELGRRDDLPGARGCERPWPSR